MSKYYQQISPYETVSGPYSEESAAVSRKLNEVLVTLRSIDQRLKNNFEPPCVPPKEEKESFVKSCDLRRGESRNTLSSLVSINRPPPIPSKEQSVIETAPPRPPRAPPLVEPEVKPDGTILLTPAHCKALLNSINKVKDFIDTEIDDEFEEKGINMGLLFGVTETLRLRPTAKKSKKFTKFII